MNNELCAKLLTPVSAIGPFQEEVKKTSIHLVRDSAFLGVHPRKHHLLITVKSDRAVESSRIVKAEQISKNRWHLDLKIAHASEIDEEFMRRVRAAYALCGSGQVS